MINIFCLDSGQIRVNLFIKMMYYNKNLFQIRYILDIVCDELGFVLYRFSKSINKYGFLFVCLFVFVNCFVM